ncbi:MarR family transcriptional regulator, partial [Streptomyces sp. NPDC003753]
RQGVGILGPGTPAGARLENTARFLDYVSESLVRAADQAREILHTKAETTAGDTAEPSSDRG